LSANPVGTTSWMRATASSAIGFEALIVSV
jgi:hypothetical protein